MNFQVPRSSVGVGLRSKHFEYFLTDVPQTFNGWLEVHPENYLYNYPKRKKLLKVSETYPIAFHFVSLSLGSSLPTDAYLQDLKELMGAVDPFMLSDHLSWSALNGYTYNDLFPVPMTNETFKHMLVNVEKVQGIFGRQFLIENPSAYITFQNNDYTEPQFLNDLAKQSGCGLLLDVNNVYVQSVNHGWDAYGYIDELNLNCVQEVHLAGHVFSDDKTFLIDTHSKPVAKPVWDLFEYVCKKMHFQPFYTLIEWDNDLPAIDVLLQEARIAETYLAEILNVFA